MEEVSDWSVRLVTCLGEMTATNMSTSTHIYIPIISTPSHRRHHNSSLYFPNNSRLYGHGARLPAEDLAHRILFCRHVLDYADRPPAFLMVASGEVVSVGHGHGGPGVCLVSDWTEAEGLPSQGEGRRAAPAYATIPDLAGSQVF